MFSSQIKTPTHISEHSASGLRRSFFGSQGNIYNPTSPKINLPSPKNMNSQRIARTNILEAILGHPEKKLVGSPVAAAASKKYFKRIGSQDESQLKIGKHDNSGSFRGLSPVAPKSLVSSSSIHHQLPIKKDKVGRKLIGSDKAERQDSELNFSVPIKEEDKSVQLQEGMRESKYDIEKELQKKELIIRIYQEILALTSQDAHNRRQMRTLQETSADICESATEDNEMKKALGDKPRLSDNRSIGNLKGRKEKVRGLSAAGAVAGATNSSYSMQQQKSTQRTLNKTSHDSKMNIRGLDVNNVNSTEESGCLTPIFYNKPSIKNARPKSGINQYRIRKGTAGGEDERSSGYSGTAHGSLSPTRKDNRYDPVILIKEGNYKSGRRSQDVTKSVNQTQIKKDTFVDLGNRLDSVFTAYNKKNEQMIKEIEDMARKITILQAARKKTAPLPK